MPFGAGSRCSANWVKALGSRNSYGAGSQDNLADFLRAARPALAANLAFERGGPVSREFITEDWKRREADLLFEVPYRWAERQVELLVWVLLEHQSDTNVAVPLRLLFRGGEKKGA